MFLPAVSGRAFEHLLGNELQHVGMVFGACEETSVGRGATLERDAVDLPTRGTSAEEAEVADQLVVADTLEDEPHLVAETVRLASIIGGQIESLGVKPSSND